MKILFDQGTPAPLRHALAGQSVSTEYEKGWSNLENGDLLAEAEKSFDLIITTDKNLAYQQNLKSRKIAILILPTTNWPRIQRHVHLVFAAVESISPAAFVELQIP
jgi:predicted nuclease of predicted toxin-antitoxin system